MTTIGRSAELINALENGKMLVQDKKNALELSIEIWPGGQGRDLKCSGWGAGLTTPQEALLIVIERPERWRIKNSSNNTYHISTLGE